MRMWTELEKGPSQAGHLMGPNLHPLSTFLLLPLDGAQDFLTICESAPGPEQKEPYRECGVGVNRGWGWGEGTPGRGRRLAPGGAVTGQLAPGGGASQAGPPQRAQNFLCFLFLSHPDFLLGPAEQLADGFRPREGRGLHIYAGPPCSERKRPGIEQWSWGSHQSSPRVPHKGSEFSSPSSAH